jgi:hypothetical protein
MVERQFCAQLARDTADPFIGTATRADSWLLIEYTAVWERREIESSHLPPQVKTWIEQIKQHATQTRFIKRDGRKSSNINVFFVITLEQRQAIYCFQFTRYEDLLTLDLAALRAGAQWYEPYRYQVPLFLVCTHGKHDACCAKFGMPVYHEFERLAGEHTWQSSHVGGDKFAANVICFPYGIYYGRVAVSEVGEIIASCNALNYISTDIVAVPATSLSFRRPITYCACERGRPIWEPFAYRALNKRKMDNGGSALNTGRPV